MRTATLLLLSLLLVGCDDDDTFHVHGCPCDEPFQHVCDCVVDDEQDDEDDE